MYVLSRGTLQKTYNVWVVILLLKDLDSCMYVLSKGTLQKTYNVWVVILLLKDLDSCMYVLSRGVERPVGSCFRELTI
jgi:hypothetical protein